MVKWAQSVGGHRAWKGLGWNVAGLVEVSRVPSVLEPLGVYKWSSFKCPRYMVRGLVLLLKLRNQAVMV